MQSAKTSRIWHPFTQMLTADPPLKVESGKGVYLELEGGKKIIDCISSWWVNIHGHAEPHIAEAIYEQAQKLEQVIFAGFTHEPAEQLAELLLSRLPDKLKHVFFSDNGSTAVEVALKLAYQYWHNLGESRPRFIAFEGGYHGDTVGAMSIGGGSPFWKKFSPLMFEIELVPYPFTYDGDQDFALKEETCLAEIKSIVSKHKGGIAAICIEPLIQGAAGMRFCRPEFLQKLSELAENENLLLIFDEVMTGFGRTGDWFAACKSALSPDLICLSKGITGGFLPLSTTICSSRIYDSFLDSTNEKTFYHGHSYTANPLACAAAVASWKLLEERQSDFKNMEALHRKIFSSTLNGHRQLKQSRFCGTVFACEMITKDSDSYFNQVSKEMKRRFIEKGVLIRPLGNTIYLMPPYCISENELEFAYKCIAQVTEEVSAIAAH